MTPKDRVFAPPDTVAGDVTGVRAFALPDLQAASDIAQLVIAVAAVAGVLVSMYLSRQALREVEADRRARQTPFLSFEGGGWRRRIEFVAAGPAIPGINPAYAAQLLPALPAGAESVRLAGPAEERHYGRLRNFGLGPAIETRAAWLATRVTIGSDEFDIDDGKRSEPLYSEALNELPLLPGHIGPQQEAELTRIPTFLEKDIDKKIRRVEGVLKITCADIAGGEHVFAQEFIAFTGYTEDPPWVHFTFGDVLNVESLPN